MAILVLSYLLVIVDLFGLLKDEDNQPAFEAVNPLPAVKIQPPVLEQMQGRYLLAGTIVLDRGIEAESLLEDGRLDYSYPFKNLKSYQPHSYDAWLADLECPTSLEDVPPILGKTTLEFNCRPGYLDYAKEYFEFFNLANNHSDNSGRSKLEETRQALDRQQIQYFGDPDSTYIDDICEVVGLPVKVYLSDQFSYIKGHLPVAMCGWHYFFRLPVVAEVEVLQRYSQLMPVFGFVHMGAEYRAKADAIQQRIARQIIDAGADFLIANNPHWVQNAEVYKDKLIVYSTGNFIFDQYFNEEVKRSASIILEIETTYTPLLQAWLDLGQTCLVHKDDCLKQAKELDLQRLDIDFKFNVVAGYIDKNQPQTKADLGVQAWVEERLNWSDLFVD